MSVLQTKAVAAVAVLAGKPRAVMSTTFPGWGSLRRAAGEAAAGVSAVTVRRTQVAQLVQMEPRAHLGAVAAAVKVAAVAVLRIRPAVLGLLAVMDLRVPTGLRS